MSEIASGSTSNTSAHDEGPGRPWSGSSSRTAWVVDTKSPSHRQSVFSPFGSQGAEDPGRAHVVRRRGEVDDECRGKQVGPFVPRLAPLVDEDVGERRCGVANVGRACEGVKYLPDAAINRG